MKSHLKDEMMMIRVVELVWRNWRSMKVNRPIEEDRRRRRKKKWVLQISNLLSDEQKM